MDRMKLFLLVFCLSMIKSGYIICADESFTVAFMTNAGSNCGTTQDLLLYIAASEFATCSISAPKATYLFATIELTVNANDAVKVKLENSLQLSGSGIIERKGISVTCNNTLVTVNGINACPTSTDGFSVIPNRHLGKTYFAFTVLPDAYDLYAQVAVVSYLDNTEVCVCLTSCSVYILSTYYGPGSCINKTLNAYESLQIKSNGNLAGTYISSNNPVAVFSGNDKTKVNVPGREHLVIQVPPLTSWGKQFVAVRTWQNDLPIFVMAAEFDTRVNITCNGTTTPQRVVVKSGEIYMTSFLADEYCFIETNFPVLIVHANGGDPTLLPLTPIDQYSANHSFISLQTADGRMFSHYFIYVIEEFAASELMLDSEPITKNQHFKQIPETTLIGGYLEVTDNNVHYVTHPYANFDGLLLGIGNSESFVLSLGRSWKTVTTDELTTYPSTYTDVTTTTKITTTPDITINPDMRTTTDITTTPEITTTPKMTTASDITTTPEITTASDITTIPDMTTTSDLTTTSFMTTTPDTTATSDMPTTTDKTGTLTVSKSALTYMYTLNSTHLTSTSKPQSTTDQTTTRNNTCENVTTLHNCNCSRPFPTRNRTRWTAILESNITREELIKLVWDDFDRNIKPNIMINRKNVSRMVRMRTSARNTEVSHRYIGLGISWIVVVPIVFGVVSDLLNFYRYCRGKKERKPTTTLS